MMAHRAPMALIPQGQSGSLVAQCGRSIIAGCNMSTTQAMACLRPTEEDDEVAQTQALKRVKREVISPEVGFTDKYFHIISFLCIPDSGGGVGAGAVDNAGGWRW